MSFHLLLLLLKEMQQLTGGEGGQETRKPPTSAAEAGAATGREGEQEAEADISGMNKTSRIHAPSSLMKLMDASAWIRRGWTASSQQTLRCLLR